MKKLFIYVLLFMISSFKAMGNDAANDVIKQNNEIREAKRIFKVMAEKEASATNIDEVLSWKNCTGKKAVALNYAIKIYFLTSNDPLNKKHSTILDCIENNPSDAGVLYTAAAFLESPEESKKVYERIAENDNFDIGFRLLSLKKLIQFETLPKSTPKILIKGALSTIPAEQKLFRELCLKLKSLNSKSAVEYTNSVEAALGKTH